MRTPTYSHLSLPPWSLPPWRGKVRMGGLKAFRMRIASRFMRLLMVLLLSMAPLPLTVHGEALDCLIEPYVVVNLGSGVPGLIDAVAVDRGDQVKKGQVIARLDSRVEQATIEVYRARATMESNIKSSEARLEMSLAQHSRNEGLFRKALISADEMDEVKTTKRLAELSLLEAQDARRLAELELRRATAELARRTIRSPINGVVVERFLSPGERVDEEPILKMAQLDPLRVEVFAPVEMLGGIAVGMQAEVTMQTPSSETHTARVTVVDRIVDAASGTFGVRLELRNRGYRMPAGLKCQVRFQQQGPPPQKGSTLQPATIPVPIRSQNHMPSKAATIGESTRVPMSVARPRAPSAPLQASPDLVTIDPFVRSWARDWARQDVKAYLAHYAREFRPPGGMSLAAWHKQRQQRLLEPAFIEIDIDNIQKNMTGSSSAQVTFSQTYRSDIATDQVTKILDMQWGNGSWTIVKETSKAR
jgi:RND family efflux transporter MFP subunit